MRIQTRILTLFLALVMCLGMFVACNEDPADTTGPADTTEGAQNPGDDSGNPPASDSKPATDVPAPKDSYVIKADGTNLNVTITRPDGLNSNSPIINRQQYIVSLLTDYLGTAPALDTDWRKTEDSETFEIIVGPCDHDEVKAVVDSCSYGEYLVQAVGNKIVVLGYTEDAIVSAVTHLANVLKQGRNTTDKTITITPDAIYKHGKSDEQLSNLPAYSGGKFLTYYDAGLADVSRQCDEIVVKKTSMTDFDAYIETLKAVGYTVYNTNEVNNSKFVTLNSAEYTINAGYYDYEESARIMIEPKAPDYSLGGEYTKVTTSNIILLGVEPKRGDLGRINGMSMVMRLEDGRFIVIDGSEDSTSLGGTKDSASNPQCLDNIKSLIKLLKSQASEYGVTRPVIAAWFLTHDHGDHSHLLRDDYQLLKDSGITVENIYASAYSAYESTNSELSSERYQKIMETVAPALGATMHRPHPGQVITYANCRIDILYTLESWADGKGVVNSEVGGFNHSSVLFKTTFTDSATEKTTSVFNTGDGSGQAMQIAMKTFGEAMIKSDIAVATHHGYGSGNDTLITNAIKVINPQIALFPRGTSDKKYGVTCASSFTGRASNLELYTIAKEAFYAGMCEDYTIIPVPYVYGQTQISSSTRLK